MSVFIELIVDDHPRGAGSLLWEDPTQRSNLLLLPNSLDHAWHHPRQHPFWSDLWWVSLQECGQSMPAWGGTDKLMLFSPLFVSLISLLLLPPHFLSLFLTWISAPQSTVYCLTSLISFLKLTSPPLCLLSCFWLLVYFCFCLPSLSPLFCFSLSLFLHGMLTWQLNWEPLLDVELCHITPLMVFSPHPQSLDTKSANHVQLSAAQVLSDRPLV